jgi:hypothetical protein
MKRLGAAAGMIVVLAGAGSAGGAAKVPPAKRSCSWGASSVTAQRVDGQWVVGTPTTTGCVP